MTVTGSDAQNFLEHILIADLVNLKVGHGKHYLSYKVIFTIGYAKFLLVSEMRKVLVNVINV